MVIITVADSGKHEITIPTERSINCSVLYLSTFNGERTSSEQVDVDIGLYEL